MTTSGKVFRLKLDWESFGKVDLEQPPIGFTRKENEELKLEEGAIIDKIKPF